MSKLQYFNDRQKLVAKHGEDSLEVMNLDNRRSAELAIGNAGSPNIDNSTQASQGGLDQRYVSGEDLSDSQRSELAWVADKMNKDAALDALADGVADIKRGLPGFYPDQD